MLKWQSEISSFRAHASSQCESRYHVARIAQPSILAFFIATVVCRLSIAAAAVVFTIVACHSPDTMSTTDSDKERDLVKDLFEQFDTDGNGFLSFDEVAKLQWETSGVTMTGDQYVLACKTLECHPKLGLTLQALRWTYAAEGSNVGA